MSSSRIFADAPPLIGGQIIVEPGMGESQIDGLFALLAASGLRIARIRMFESYMEGKDGSRDYTLFDHAFRAADRHGVRLFATLFPATSFEDVGGFKFPRSDAHYRSIVAYVRDCVAHFSRFASCAGWVLINEPGVGGMPTGDFVEARLAAYLASQPFADRTPNGYPAMDFRAEQFLMELTTGYLEELAREVRSVDPDSHVHLNPHGVFGSVLCEYDFPRWRRFLDSFGGSAHPSWHFGLFTRDRFAVAMAANCSIIASAAGATPWMMTEVQGGTNTYSGARPLCPTAREIAQWLWIIIGSGGRGAIFWSFNQRSSGFEAGEWGLISLTGGTTERLEAAAGVGACIAEHEAFFRNAKPITSPIAVLYVREALWVDRRLHRSYSDEPAGRSEGAPLHSALGWYEALTSLGCTPRLGELREYDLGRESFAGETIVLSHQVALSSSLYQALHRFVEGGGRLIVDGLSAYYDEHAHCVMQTGFPLARLFGGRVREVKHVSELFTLAPSAPFPPAHLWKGIIEIEGGTPIIEADGVVLGVRNRYGSGEVMWIPSCLGLAARVQSAQPLASFAHSILKDAASDTRGKLPPLAFDSPHEALLMRALATDEVLVTILVNKAAEPVEATLTGSVMEGRSGGEPRGAGELWFADGDDSSWTEDGRVRVLPDQTLVLAWKQV